MYLEWYQSYTILGRYEKIVTQIMYVFCDSDEEPQLRKAAGVSW